MSQNTVPVSFGARLQTAFSRYGQLCVGLDPHPGMLTQWGLSEDVAGLREFGSRVIEACADRVGVVKPQVAFYEAFGPRGLEALAHTMGQARDAGLLVVADAKRGDIGSTMAAYAQAWLNPANELAADALTVSPYLGVGALDSAFGTARHHGAGLFVLAVTSNPEGVAVQLAKPTAASGNADQDSVAAAVATEVASWNLEADPGSTELGSAGLVVGATTAHLAAEHGVDLKTGRPPLLAPGYGAQGATAADLKQGFGAAWPQVLVNSSRAILREGPEVSDLIRAVDSSVRELA